MLLVEAIESSTEQTESLQATAAKCGAVVLAIRFRQSGLERPALEGDSPVA